MDFTVFDLARQALMALLVMASPSAGGIGARSAMVDAQEILALLPSRGPASAELGEAREVPPERRDMEPGQAPARRETLLARIMNLVVVAVLLTMAGIAIFNEKWRNTWMLGIVVVVVLVSVYLQWRETGTLMPQVRRFSALLVAGAFLLVLAWRELRDHLESRDQKLD